MTRYTVVYEEDARFDLAEIWLNVPDHNAITVASHTIDRELAEDADVKGRELSEGLRSLTISPLKATFEAREDDRIVKVYRIRQV